LLSMRQSGGNPVHEPLPDRGILAQLLVTVSPVEADGHLRVQLAAGRAVDHPVVLADIVTVILRIRRQRSDDRLRLGPAEEAAGTAPLHPMRSRIRLGRSDARAPINRQG